MYGTGREIRYLYIRTSAPQDRGEPGPLRADPIGPGRRRGMRILLGVVSYVHAHQRDRDGGGHRAGVLRNFYEKALFVKVDLATTLWLTPLLCPSRYASICTLRELTLLVARCIMGSVLIRAKGAAIFRAVFLEGWTKFAIAQSPYARDPKRVRARSAVAIRHFRVA
jgi:hypothetical protein